MEARGEIDRHPAVAVVGDRQEHDPRRRHGRGRLPRAARGEEAGDQEHEQRHRGGDRQPGPPRAVALEDRLQRFPHRARVGRPLGRILLQHPQDQAVERLGNPGFSLRGGIGATPSTASGTVPASRPVNGRCPVNSS